MEIPARNSLFNAYLIIAFCVVVGAIYGFKGIGPSPVAQLFLSFAPMVAVLVWLHRDIRSTGQQVQDWGFFLCVAWPVLPPWHIFKTRRAGRWGLTLKLFALVIAPSLARSVARVIRVLG